MCFFFSIMHHALYSLFQNSLRSMYKQTLNIIYLFILTIMTMNNPIIAILSSEKLKLCQMEKQYEHSAYL